MRNPYDLSWPHAKGLLSWIKARIKLFHLTNIIYKEAGQKIQKIEKVQAQIVWYLGELNVRYFHLRGSPGIIEGSIGASFTRTKLNANFKIKPDIPLYGLNLFQFKVNLDRVSDPHQISGPMTLIGMSGNNEQVKLSGFGNFDLRDKSQRPGRNPKTGEEIPITARRVVTFHASQKLKAMVEAANHAGSQPS